MFSLPLIDPVAGPRDFLAGEENALVQVAGRVVLEHRTDRLPLVIYGPTGVGKTFLAEGLADKWRQASPGREVLRFTGADFARDYANACVTDSIEDLRTRLLKPGLIVIDAVHTLVEKQRATREFCYQLDQWLRRGKVVIITSLVAPSELADEGLASRLSAGLVVPLVLPSVATRRELLVQFARQRSLKLSEELTDRLAKHLPGAVHRVASPRDLDGVLLKLESKARITGSAIDAELVDSLLKPATTENPIDAKRIFSAVARRFGVTVDELRSSSRRQTLVRARGVAILLARRLTRESLQALGQLLGKRDHSTIHHALEITEGAMAADDTLRELVEQIEAEITQNSAAKPQSKRTPRRG